MHRARLVIVLAVAIAGCGSSAKHSASTTTPAASSTSSTTASGSSGCRTVPVPAPKPSGHLPVPHLKLDPHRTYTVTIVTNCGTFALALDVTQSPKTSASFYSLVKRGFFDGVTFHRVAAGFVIQGGDPTGTGTGDPGYMFADEFDPNLNFDVPGRMAMANSGPGTNGSQFFITEVPTTHLNQKHTIFGQCDQPSLSIVSAIARVQRDADDKPVQPVVLNKVTIVKEGQPLPPLPPAPAAPPAAAPTQN